MLSPFSQFLAGEVGSPGTILPLVLNKMEIKILQGEIMEVEIIQVEVWRPITILPFALNKMEVEILKVEVGRPDTIYPSS